MNKCISKIHAQEWRAISEYHTVFKDGQTLSHMSEVGGMFSNQNYFLKYSDICCIDNEHGIPHKMMWHGPKLNAGKCGTSAFTAGACHVLSK